MTSHWAKRAGLILLTGSALLGGCRNDDGDTAQVRLINAVSSPNELSVVVGGRTVWKHAPYRENTGYQKIRQGQYDVALDADSPGVPKAIAFEKGKAYTVLALGQSNIAPPVFRVFGDDPAENVPEGKTCLHFINAVSEPGGMDVLFNNIVGLKRILYGHRSEALLLDEGDYDIKINPADEIGPLIGPINLHLEAGRAYTIVAMGRRPAPSLTLEVYPDGD